MVRKRPLANPIDPKLVAKQRLASETGYAHKDRGGRLAVALVYPNSYEVAMSNLGFQKIYKILNDRDDVVCERAFMPSSGELEFLSKKGEAITTMESGAKLAGFDVVAFSITFEMDYINVLAMLELARISRKERSAHEPLVMAGGVAITLNPEVIAPFMDIMVIGEGDDIIGPFCDVLIEHGKSDLSSFAGIPGFYIPSGYTLDYNEDGGLARREPLPGYPGVVNRAWSREYAEQPNVTHIDAPKSVFGDMALVEMGKGCGRHCRFCAAGYVYRPTRYISTDAIIEAIDTGIERKGKVGLVGSAICDHPDVHQIFEHIVGRGGKFSVSSLRLDKLSDHLIELLHKGGAKSVTVAPEAGSERMRLKINKDIKDETIIDTAYRVAKVAPFNLKLYFIVGLPGETMEDVEAIVDLVERIRVVMEPEWKKHGRTGDIVVGVDGFVPKANTPYQWEPFEGIKPVTAKLNVVAEGLRKTPNVTVQKGSARQGYVQTLLSQGDRHVAEALELAQSMGGDWSGALRGTSINTDRLVLQRKSVDALLPWAFIDHGMRDDYLSRELSLSEKGKVTPRCPDDKCERCGEFDGICR